MDLKDFIIQEFNTLVDNMQNSFIEALKKRLLDPSLAFTEPVEKLIEDQALSLPLKRKDSKPGSRLKKLSKITDESEEEQYNPDVSLIPQKKEVKLKKSSAVLDTEKEENEYKSQAASKDKFAKGADKAKDKVERIEKPIDKQVEEKRSDEKPEEKLNESVKNHEAKEKTGENKLAYESSKSKHEEIKQKSENKSSESKNPPKKFDQENEKNEETKFKVDQKPNEQRTIPKKPEDDKAKVVKAPVERKEKPNEPSFDTIPHKVVVQVDEKKVRKWNEFYSEIIDPISDTELHRTLLKFSSEIDEKIQENEIKYIEKSLAIIQNLAKNAKTKPIKLLAQSLISRCKEKLPKKPHISDHLQSLGIGWLANQ